jgi:hypothetical protein
MLANANLALRFLLELAGIVALGWWGLHIAGGLIGIILGIGAPVALIAVWSLFIAPKALYPQSPQFRLVAGTILLEIAALSLVTVGAPQAALVLGLAILLNAIGLAASGAGDPR